MDIVVVALFLIPTVVSIISPVLRRLVLRKFLGIFFFAFAIVLTLGFISDGILAVYWSLIQCFVAMSATAVIAGTWGERISQETYASVITGLGLFPWWVDGFASCVYAGGLILFTLFALWLFFKPTDAVKRFREKAGGSRESHVFQAQFAIPIAALSPLAFFVSILMQ